MLNHIYAIIQTVLLKALLAFTALWLCISAQAQMDSTATFTYQEFLAHIIDHHPLAIKANLRLKYGEANVLSARGKFDPVLKSSYDKKEFDDKLYYSHFASKLIIPTPLGIDVVGGYENTDGEKLNPERYTDENGLWHMGVEVNVLQGLWVNDRKVALQQAKVYQQMAQVEQQSLLNELVFNATYKYLLWQQSHFNHQVLENNLSIANDYFTNTRLSYKNGEKTAMDTLETLIVYQDAQRLLNKNKIALTKARNDIETYLWYEQKPVLLQEQTLPENYENKFFVDFSLSDSTDLSANPLIQSSLNKLSILEIEQRLKRQKVLPKLKVKYNALLATNENSITPNYSSSNYKWGLDFSFPIFLRSERGDIKQGKIKIEELELDIANKRYELQNKLESSLQKQIILEEQITILNKSVDGYKQLLEGENEKVKYGESSVFLLNKRQEKYINGNLKLIETYVKKQMELVNFLYLSNQLVAK
ncbi:TolC family protein [Labilibacter marinus]|uniref:TolC family protein n=1 Tax=Labilibacter marinus TaxID=1477105 RepID=UPI000831CDDF|nr:TolC family protein [Labilibacter marinus]